MRALPADLRRELESAVLEGRHAAEAGVRAAFSALEVAEREKPAHLDEEQAQLRRGLRAKQRQLGGEYDVLVWDAAYEQWHKLLFARFLAENDLLRHPEFGASVTLEDCQELAEELGEPDGWSVAAEFAAEILPGIFRLDDPCLRLRLAPEHRKALEKILAAIPDEIFRADDSLGWVYQYWQAERKDAVNASEVKIGGAELGPVTQLFTENYMVRFLLENSLGAWWVARHPDSAFVQEFDYLRIDDGGQPAAGRFEGWPETAAEVTVMDPCCGSGHFLVEAFGMLWRMRAEEEALEPVAAQDAVLRDNLFGLELDPRCVQIAMFALALAAWKQGGGWRELPTPNVACSGTPAKSPLDEWLALAEGDDRLEQALGRLHELFKEADTLGSLIQPRLATELSDPSRMQRSLEDVAFEDVAPLLDAATKKELKDPAVAVLGADAAGIARAARLLAGNYTLAVTNPPFLTRSKFNDVLLRYTKHVPSGADQELANLFQYRCGVESWSLSQAMVLPQAWMTLARYRGLRSWLLDKKPITMLARIGEHGFESAAAAGAFVVLAIGADPDTDVRRVSVLDCGQAGEPSGKAGKLRDEDLGFVDLDEIGSFEDLRFTLQSRSSGLRLGEFARAWQGISTSDFPRFGRFFWEVPAIVGGWKRQQSTVKETILYGGREAILYWEDGHGKINEVCQPGATFRGNEAWGKRGVVVSQMRSLPATLYTGELSDSNAAMLVPDDQDLVPALWCYVSSPDFHEQVRIIDQSVKVTNSTFGDIPFDVDHWTEIAEERYPTGLPDPWSNDPTQWLFHGRPQEAEEGLQAAVGRLMGYRWPDQEDGELYEFADADGIACLSAVVGEQPAARRLEALLAHAFDDRWSPGVLRDLIGHAGSRKKNLGEWLRDDFFKHHCSVFSQRPFVWHIWDGRKDGFAALVNYHRLDRAGLEKLTYTYLGDWIERQRADAAEDVAGADLRLAAARELKDKLEAILRGEPPYDIYVRWKELHAQPLGWEPDWDDGVRINIRPFVEAGVLRSKMNVHWRKDRGKNADGSERLNDLHSTIAEKQQARERARPS